LGVASIAMHSDRLSRRTGSEQAQALAWFEVTVALMGRCTRPPRLQLCLYCRGRGGVPSPR